MSYGLNGMFDKNLNVNGVFIVVWLDNGLIKVSPMPTIRRRMNLQTRDISSHLTDLVVGTRSSLIWTFT